MSTIAAERVDEAVRTDFIREARTFCGRHRGDAAFRWLRAALGCSEAELEQVMGKVWCDASPRNYGPVEGLATSLLKLAALPLYYLLSGRLHVRRGCPAEYGFEGIDTGYFETWLKPVAERLGSTRWIAPARAKVEAPDWTAPLGRGVTPRTLLWLLPAPLAVPALWALSRRYGRNLAAPFRQALGLFAAFDAHFRRYPCNHFLACTDDHNHPSRLIAFRRHCGGRFAVLQNGERTLHPVYAFGAMDDYLSFGQAMKALAPKLCLSVGRVIPVGAMYLNGRLASMPELRAVDKEIDLLFVDQLVWPYNGFDAETGREFERCFDWLDALKAARPRLRVAYQLRHYADPSLREAVLARIRPHFKHEIELLSNEGRGESYRNAARSRIVATFQSTFAYEAFFVGRGTIGLYVNPTHNPYELYCDDPRFQLHAPDGDPEPFIRKVDELLALRLDEPPPAARERHAYTDGRVAERIAAALQGPR